MTNPVESAPPARPRWRLSPGRRRALLTVHIVVAVGLLGDSAGFLAVAIRAAGTEDPQLAAEHFHILELFAAAFGIPLSFATLFTGIALGLTSKWGIFRYPWVMAKLALIVSVILVGALVIDGALQSALEDPPSGETTLIVAASWDVFALALATSLAVFKPGRRLRRGDGGEGPGPGEPDSPA